MPVADYTIKSIACGVRLRMLNDALSILTVFYANEKGFPQEAFLFRITFAMVGRSVMFLVFPLRFRHVLQLKSGSRHAQFWSRLVLTCHLLLRENICRRCKS